MCVRVPIVDLCEITAIGCTSQPHRPRSQGRDGIINKQEQKNTNWQVMEVVKGGAKV